MSCKIPENELLDLPPCESKKSKIWAKPPWKNKSVSKKCEHNLAYAGIGSYYWDLLFYLDLYWLAPKPTSSCRRSMFMYQIMINYLLKRKYLPRFSLYRGEPDYNVQKLTCLEFWFTPYLKEESSSVIPLNPPPRYKMAIVTIPVISILLLTLVPQIHILTEMLLIPYAIRLIITITITVLLMTYIIMPLLTKILRIWLFKR